MPFADPFTACEVAVKIPNAARDYYRYRNLRAPEVLAASLDAPFAMKHSEGNIEDEGVLADTIPDEEFRPQAFQFEHLRDQLTDEEYTVLYETTVNGVKQTELAEESGKSKSATSRVKARAEEKAAKWLSWLKNSTYKQVKSHISMTYSRRPSLRPNKIAKSTLDIWNERDRGLQVVPWHDEASEWRPAIMNQGHIRAKRECWNRACQGIAVGRTNLVLPYSQRQEAVRFLPNFAGRDNDFCESCKQAAKRAEGLQTVSDRPERLIERTEPTAEVISFVEQSGMQNPKVKAATFFGPSGFSSNESKTHMDYRQAAAIIKDLDIPRSTVARLANMHATEVSAWLGGKLTFSQEKIERITQVVTDIEKVVTVMPMKVDLRDPENVRKLIVAVNDAEAQLNLPLAHNTDERAGVAN